MMKQIAAGCPWSTWKLSPTAFCEETLCAWIRQPAATWSNLAFVIVGLIIVRRTRTGQDAHFSGLGWVAIITGAGSFFYHASETWIGAIADYLGMYLGSTYMLTMNLHRYFGWGARLRTLIYWSVLFILLGSMIVAPTFSRVIYGGLGSVSCLLLEGLIYIRNRKNHGYIRYFWLAMVWLSFALAYGVWMLDESRVVCDPKNHYFNGHALWHVINAISLYCLFLYYRQFTWMNNSRAARVPKHSSALH